MLRVLVARQTIVTTASAGLPAPNGSASYARAQLGARGILKSRGAYQQLNNLADEAETVNAGSVGSIGRPFAGRVLNPITLPINLYQGALSAS